MEKKKKVSSVFQSNTFSKLAIASFMMLLTLVFFSCAEEDYVPGEVGPSNFEVKFLNVSADVNDTLQKSVSFTSADTFRNFTSKLLGPTSPGT